MCRGDEPAHRAARLPGPRVADAMLTIAKLCDVTTRIGVVQAMFADEHVHAAVVVDHGVLRTVIERADLSGSAAHWLAVDTGTLDGRVVGPDAPLEPIRRLMLARQRRRLAVIDDDGRYLGLLCLKRTGLGFCSDDNVRAHCRSLRGTMVSRPE